jgi:hypothetical protein
MWLVNVQVEGEGCGVGKGGESKSKSVKCFQNNLLAEQQKFLLGG